MLLIKPGRYGVSAGGLRTEARSSAIESPSPLATELSRSRPGPGRLEQRRRSQTLDGKTRTDDASVQAGVYRKTLEMRRDKARRKGIAGTRGIDDLRRAAEPPMKAVFPGVVQNAASRSLLEHDEPEAAGCQPGKHPLRVDLGLLEEQLADSPAGRGPFR
jgi:hypothetical protein